MILTKNIFGGPIQFSGAQSKAGTRKDILAHMLPHTCSNNPTINVIWTFKVYSCSPEQCVWITAAVPSKPCQASQGSEHELTENAHMKGFHYLSHSLWVFYVVCTPKLYKSTWPKCCRLTYILLPRKKIPSARVSCSFSSKSNDCRQ